MKIEVDLNDKEQALDLISSLTKSFNIDNKEYMQRGITGKKSTNKQSICCLISDEVYNKYKQYTKNNNVNTISGTRYYYYCEYLEKNSVKYYTTNQIIEKCGYTNDASVNNINKPGFEQLYTPIGSGDRNLWWTNKKNTYFKFTRPILQNSKNNTFGIYNNLHIEAYLNSPASYIHGSIGDIGSMQYINKSLSVPTTEISKTIIAGESRHYIVFQQIGTFVPCFKV